MSGHGNWTIAKKIPHSKIKEKNFKCCISKGYYKFINEEGNLVNASRFNEPADEPKPKPKAWYWAFWVQEPTYCSNGGLGPKKS